MRVQVLGADYTYRNAPTLSGYGYIGAPKSAWNLGYNPTVSLGANPLEVVRDAWGRFTGSFSVPVEPPPAPSFMDQYGTYVVGGVAVVGVLVTLKALKGKRRGRRRR